MENYQHPYAYKYPKQKPSFAEFECSPNPTPLSPINQQSSHPTMSFVEKSKSFLSLLPRACTPLGNLSEAIAVEDEEKTKNRKSIWSYLDPNDDLNDYESSDNSSDPGSPRKRGRDSRRRRRRSFDDDRHARKQQQSKHPPPTVANPPPDFHIRQNPDEENERIDKIVYESNVDTRHRDETYQHHDAFKRSSRPQYEWDNFEDPFNELPMDGCESDVIPCQYGTQDKTRYSTGGIITSNNYRQTRRNSGPTPPTFESQKRSTSTGRGHRVDDLLSKYKETNKGKSKKNGRRSKSPSNDHVIPQQTLSIEANNFFDNPFTGGMTRCRMIKMYSPTKLTLIYLKRFNNLIQDMENWCFLLEVMILAWTTL